jgi:hypothetical protein
MEFKCLLAVPRTPAGPRQRAMIDTARSKSSPVIGMCSRLATSERRLERVIRSSVRFSWHPAQWLRACNSALKVQAMFSLGTAHPSGGQGQGHR